MTKLLQKAFQKASALTEREQDTLAAVLLEEIKSELKWKKLFTDHPEVLENLGEDAKREIEAGKTTNLEFDRKL